MPAIDLVGYNANGQVPRAEVRESCDQPAADAASHGIELAVVTHAEPKRGFVLPPRRWVVERSLARLARFHPLARLRAVGGHARRVALGAFVALLLHRATITLPIGS